MRRVLVLVLVALLCVSLAGLAVAKNKGNKPVKVKTMPFILNPPTGAGLAAAAWVTHQGLPDAGKSDHALYFKKTLAAPADTQPGAVVSGVNGITLTELGFDIRNDGRFSDTSPRIVVKGQDGLTYPFVLGLATLIPEPISSADWTQVRFPYMPPPAPAETPLSIVVDSITIYFDDVPGEGELDFVYLDNIDVNGALMGKPGNAKVPVH